MDHWLTAGPSLLPAFVAAYLASLRTQLLGSDTAAAVHRLLAQPPNVDLAKTLARWGRVGARGLQQAHPCRLATDTRPLRAARSAAA
jgi:hypothetical protein